MRLVAWHVTGAALAMAFGVVACFSTTFWLAVSSFWVFNMLGAALLPGAFGLMLAAVRPERTSAASAIAQIPINLLGMAGGEIVWGLAVPCAMVLHLLKWAGAYIPGWLTGCNQEELPDIPLCDAGLPFDPS